MNITNQSQQFLPMRHSCEHVLTQAMIQLFGDKNIIMAMGPATDEGFYFDFDNPASLKISEADFPKIESEMAKIIQKNLPIKKEQLSIDQARKLFKHNPYKQEWLDQIEQKGEMATVYWTGSPEPIEGFVDLCSGPHVSSTGKIGPFKLLSIAGAYWHGDEKNKMLTRIYGTCFSTQKELDHHLWQLEEAKKRDHRKLGKQLDLFILSDELGPGLVIWTPKGAIIRREIESLIINEQIKRGYQHVFSPHIGKKSLWVTSGHWDLYRDKMYSPLKIDQDEYLVKPMNCPMHMMVYKSKPRSYKELPLRIAEDATVYRYEQSGELSGMTRVRYITQDDAHIFCTKTQVTDEFINVLEYIIFLLKAFKINTYTFRLSLRDQTNKDKYLGGDKIWQEAEQAIEKAVIKSKVLFTKKLGEAAFYGPKLDVMIKDALDREWQCGTIQIDFMLPERFNLEYHDETGKILRPALIHRAPLGSLERFVGLLIEHFAGAFPVWLSPVQVVIIPIADRHHYATEQLAQTLKQSQIRTEVDERSETMQAKIRDATLQKIPYMGIIGDKEIKTKPITISVRTREGDNLGNITINDFVEKITAQIQAHK